VILLDASALIALLRNEPGASTVESILRDEGPASITTFNLAEVIDVVCRRGNRDPSVVRSAIGTLDPVLTVLPVDEELALRAGALRARCYHRDRQPVSIADCVLVSAARDGDSVASSDSATLAVAASEGVGTRPLPESAGRLPKP
jgi:ribonuclease VapC